MGLYTGARKFRGGRYVKRRDAQRDGRDVRDQEGGYGYGKRVGYG